MNQAERLSSNYPFNETFSEGGPARFQQTPGERSTSRSEPSPAGSRSARRASTDDKTPDEGRSVTIDTLGWPASSPRASTMGQTQPNREAAGALHMPPNSGPTPGNTPLMSWKSLGYATLVFGPFYVALFIASLLLDWIRF